MDDRVVIGIMVGDDYQPLRANLPFYGKESGFDKVALVSTRDQRITSLLQEYGFDVHYREFTVHSDQRNRLLELVGPRWLFQIDADERPEAGLLHEIRELARDGGAEDTVYVVARCNYFMNRFMRHGKQYPDYQKRFFFNEGIHYEGMVHEIMVHSKNVVPLKGRLLHYSDEDISTRLFKVVVYSLHEAEGKKRKATLGGLIFKPLAFFFLRLIVDRAFLDGIAGIVWLIQSTLCYQMEFLVSYYWRRKREALPVVGWNGSRPSQSDPAGLLNLEGTTTKWGECYRPPAFASRAAGQSR